MESNQVTLHVCPLGHVVCHLEPHQLPGHCIECESELVPVIYAPYVDLNSFPVQWLLYTNNEGYVCFEDKHNLPGPGILWMIHQFGWVALIDNEDHELLYITESWRVPGDDDLESAVDIYEFWYKLNKGELDGKNNEKEQS